MRSIIYSALKVIAIILFVVTIVPSIISLIVIWFAPTGDVSSYNLNMILMWFLQIGFYSILAIYLWLAANKLSIMISRDNEQDYPTEGGPLAQRHATVREHGRRKILRSVSGQQGQAYD